MLHTPSGVPDYVHVNIWQSDMLNYVHNGVSPNILHRFPTNRQVSRILCPYQPLEVKVIILLVPQEKDKSGNEGDFYAPPKM